MVIGKEDERDVVVEISKRSIESLNYRLVEIQKREEEED